MKFGRNLTIFSWAMYDFASTIFSMNVITLYFALWVTVDMHHQDIFYSLSYSGSMLFAAIIAPMIGTVSDHLHKKMPFLIVLTLVTVIFTALIGLTHEFFLALIFFAIANFCFQLGDIIYNALLPDVSEGKEIGKVSGFGKGIAYLGTIVGLVIISPFAIRHGRHATFIPSAVIFLIFALPCFILVKDKKQFQLTKHKIKWLKTTRQSFKEIKQTIRNIKKYQGLGSFLFAIFLAFNAINTVFIFMSVYTQKVIGFDDAKIVTFYIVSSGCAIIGSLFSGYMTDKLGAKQTLSYSLWLWLITLIVVTLTQNPIVFWVLGPIIGLGMGATWTSARTLATKLSPQNRYGEIFGFYGLVIKLAAIVGPLVWGGIVLTFNSMGLIKYHLAIASLALFILLSLLVLRKVPSPDIALSKNIGMQHPRETTTESLDL